MRTKRIVSLIMTALIYITILPMNIRAEESSSMDIVDMLYAKGFISMEEAESASIVELVSAENAVQLCESEDVEQCKESFEGVLITSTEDEVVTADILVPYVENENGYLEALSSYTARGVADPRVFEQQISQIDFCVVKIKVSYDFYPQNLNGWAYPYYRHGILNVTVSHSTVTADNYISDLEVRYMSRGMKLNPDNLDSIGFGSALSIISKPSVVTQNSYTVVGDRPYFYRDSSSVEDGPAFSAVAYKFTYKGVNYDPIVCVIQKDIDDSVIDFFMGIEWEW